MNDPNLPIPGAPSCDALAPFTVTPPNNRGGSQRLVPPVGASAVGPSLAVFDTKGDGVRRAQLIGVQLGLRLEKGKPADYLVNQFARGSVVAELTWAIGSSTEFRAECDWMHGTQISVLAETVQVAARYEKSTFPWAPAPEDTLYPTFVVNGGVAYGAMNRISSGARLTKFAYLEPQESVNIPIPPFATSFTIIPTLFGLAQVTATVRSFGLVTASYVIDAPLRNTGQHNVENSFPLFNGAEFVTITNASEQSRAVAAVVFCLAL